MKLASLREFGEITYTDRSRPSPDRLRRMAERGDIPAVRQGSRWFVDLDKLKESDSTADAYYRKIMTA